MISAGRVAQLGGPLHMQDGGNNAQDSFYAPPGLVHKQSSNLIQIFPTEVWNEFNIPTFVNGKNYSIWFKISNNSPIFDAIRNEKTLFAQHYSTSILQK